MSKEIGALSALEHRLNDVPGMPELIKDEYALLVTEEDAAAQIAALVRQLREDAGLSQSALGQRVHVTQARISQIEQGNSTYGMSIVLIARLFAACGKTLHLSSAR
jgi:DNA-binding XRE family transcriptional regulator